MSNEKDTFDALRQSPFVKVLDETVSIQAGTEEYERVLTAHNWTNKEFIEACRRYVTEHQN